MADWLALSRPHLSKELVDDEAFDWLLKVARHLPGDAMAAIEVRLAPGKAPVDLSVRLMEPQQGIAIAPHLPPSCDFLEQLFRDWAEGAPSTRGIHSLWLEFDADRNVEKGLPEPVLCARLQTGLEMATVIENLWPRLQPSPLTSTQQRLLKRAWCKLSDSLNPLYVFSMAPRRRGVVRFEVYAENFDELLAWLRRIDHPMAEHLGWRFGAFKNVDRLHVSCDAGSEGWLARVGLEGSFRRWPHQEPGWRRLLDELVAQGQFSTSKAEAVWQWPGYAPCPSGFHVRALSHVKLRLQLDSPIQTKVYFLLQKLSAGTQDRSVK